MLTLGSRPIASQPLASEPASSTSTTIALPAGALVLTGFAPTVQIGVTIALPAGALILTGFAPSLPVTLPVGALTLTGFAPVVLNSGAAVAVAGSSQRRARFVTLFGKRYELDDEGVYRELERQLKKRPAQPEQRAPDPFSAYPLVPAYETVMRQVLRAPGLGYDVTLRVQHISAQIQANRAREDDDEMLLLGD